jgi:hypothetical protein
MLVHLQKIMSVPRMCTKIQFPSIFYNVQKRQHTSKIMSVGMAEVVQIKHTCHVLCH